MSKRLVSFKRRHLAMTPRDHLAVAELHDLLETLHASISALVAAGGPAAVVQPMMALANDALEELVELTTISKAMLPKRVPRTPEEYRRMLDLPSIMEMFRGHEGTFLNLYGLTLGEYNRLVATDFLGTIPFQIQRRGTLSVASAILLLFARMRSGVASLVAFSDFFGFDASFASAFLSAIFDRVMMLHDHRLRLDAMRQRFSHRLDLYRDALEYVYSKNLGQLPNIVKLPHYFADCCFAMDGLRMRASARPRKAKRHSTTATPDSTTLRFSGSSPPTG